MRTYAIYFATTFLSEPQKYIELINVSGYIQPGHHDSLWFTSSLEYAKREREDLWGKDEAKNFRDKLRAILLSEVDAYAIMKKADDDDDMSHSSMDIASIPPVVHKSAH